ncbi:MAG: ATPase P [Desulfobacteraceae bacterium IS3]|nr:MAG: ATPase P [Desulfobacteraceae bacterium IS3]HAO19369.1 ATPase P [Desulfobacteraceae bacterium]
MIETTIPGYKTVRLEHLVLDFNGTLACDGVMIAGVKSALNALAELLEIHVLTADTFGKAAAQLADVKCKLSILPIEKQDSGKLDYVKKLGCDKTCCMGNGRNDRLMLKESALGVAVILEEGASAETLASADIVCTSILSALDLLTHPLRLVATLRS